MLSKCSTPELHSQAFPIQLYIDTRLSKGNKRLEVERVTQMQRDRVRAGKERKEIR